MSHSAGTSTPASRARRSRWVPRLPTPITPMRTVFALSSAKATAPTPNAAPAAIYYLTDWVNYRTSGVMKLTPK